MTLKASDLPAATQRRMGIKAPSTARVAGGKRANDVGGQLEDFIVAAAARDSKIVDIDQLPKCGAEFIGKDRIISKPIDCDFHGNLCVTGRGIFFDAKHCEHETCFDLGNEKMLKDHQARFLHRKDARGAIAGILVCNRGRFLWLAGEHLGPGRGRLGWEHHAWLHLGKLLSFEALLNAIRLAAHEGRPA